MANKVLILIWQKAVTTLYWIGCEHNKYNTTNHNIWCPNITTYLPPHSPFPLPFLLEDHFCQVHIALFSKAVTSQAKLSTWEFLVTLLSQKTSCVLLVVLLPTAGVDGPEQMIGNYQPEPCSLLMCRRSLTFNSFIYLSNCGILPLRSWEAEWNNPPHPTRRKNSACPLWESIISPLIFMSYGYKIPRYHEDSFLYTKVSVIRGNLSPIVKISPWKIPLNFTESTEYIVLCTGSRKSPSHWIFFVPCWNRSSFFQLNPSWRNWLSWLALFFYQESLFSYSNKYA